MSVRQSDFEAASFGELLAKAETVVFGLSCGVRPRASGRRMWLPRPSRCLSGALESVS